MTRRLFIPGLMLVLVSGILSAYAQQATPPKTSVKVGDMAPDFTLKDQDRKDVKLSDFSGKQNVVLAFYSLAFTGG
jgi:peroxiredoxin